MKLGTANSYSNIDRSNGAATHPEGLTPEIARWRSRSEGALTFIVRPDGSDASEGFHSFTGISTPAGASPGFLIIGTRGSASSILVFDPESQTFSKRSEFQDLQFRPDLEAYTASNGSLTYIIDPRTGDLVSDGFHQISRTQDGRYWGTTGAQTVEISFNKELHPVSPTSIEDVLLRLTAK